MELLPASKNYDQVSEQVRTFSANALYEMIAGLRPYVSEALSDAAGIHDLEPSRLVAYTTLLKLQSSLIKDLGLLYRVQDRPADEDDDKIPAATVARMLEEQATRHAEELEQVARDVETRVRIETETRQRLSLEAARSQVVGSLAALKGR